MPIAPTSWCHPQHIKAALLCEPCGRRFFGPTCLQNHLKYITGEFQPHNSVCKQVRHCKDCGKLNNGYQNIKEHKCGYSICPTCKAYANVHTQHCFIESAREVKRKKEEIRQRQRAAKRRAQTAEAATDSPVEDSPEPMDILEEEFLAEEDVIPASPVDQPDKKKHPLHVYFDLEAHQDEGTHIANLCVYQTDEGQERIIRGEDCLKTFIEDLKAFTEEDT